MNTYTQYLNINIDYEFDSFLAGPMFAKMLYIFLRISVNLNDS